ncbi:MAG: hypothetical protein ACKVHE_25250 [Planctomycetales bacterium]
MSSELPNIDEVVSDLRETASTGDPTGAASSASTIEAVDEFAAVALAAAPTSAPTESVPKPRGFQANFATQAPWPPGGAAGPGLSPPKPMPKRPQGRFLVGAIFSTVVGTILLMVWNSFLGVAAYGTVTGDTL